MSLDERPYDDADLPRLQEALAGWRREAGLTGCCHVGDLPHRIYEEPAGRGLRANAVWIWADAGGIAGLAITLRFGNAFDLFTRPDLRGTNAERRMLLGAYETTARLMSPVDGEPWIVTDVFGDDEVRATMLAELGFENYRFWDHVTERSLADPILQSAPPDGFTVRGATPDDDGQLAVVRNDVFGSSWSAETLRHEVLDKPGYDRAWQTVAVSSTGVVAAFAGVWLDELNRVGHVEPVGTASAFRRRGLARAVMVHGLREMHRSGMQTATVQYDASNQAAHELYGGLGFRTIAETLGFRRSRVT